MAPRRRLGWGGALIACVLLVAVWGCDSDGGGSSPFRNLGKRGDSALPGSASRPAPR